MSGKRSVAEKAASKKKATRKKKAASKKKATRKKKIAPKKTMASRKTEALSPPPQEDASRTDLNATIECLLALRSVRDQFADAELDLLTGELADKLVFLREELDRPSRCATRASRRSRSFDRIGGRRLQFG